VILAQGSFQRYACPSFIYYDTDNQNGVSIIDDSKSMLFTSDGFVAARKQDVGRSDIYIFGYGQDYREALNAYYTVSGKSPVLPRWAFGNWWSRFCKSSFLYSQTTSGRNVADRRRLYRQGVCGLDGSIQG